MCNYLSCRKLDLDSFAYVCNAVGLQTCLGRVVIILVLITDLLTMVFLRHFNSNLLGISISLRSKTLDPVYLCISQKKRKKDVPSTFVCRIVYWNLVTHILQMNSYLGHRG